MKTVPLLSLVEPWLIIPFLLISSLTSLQLSSGLSVISSGGGGGGEEPRGTGSLQSNHTGLVHLNHHHHRVKRQLVAYHRLEAGGVLPVLANRRRGGGGRRNAVGEDGTDNGLFKSAGLGYEHKHNDRCEESKCGYNIRHCPHGCVFNSFTCGGGNMYDTCCC